MRKRHSSIRKNYKILLLGYRIQNDFYRHEEQERSKIKKIS